MLLSLVFASTAYSAELAQCSLDASSCPGSPVSKHAACGISIKFSNTCADVQEEIAERISKNMDRKSHPGVYAEIDSVSGSCIKASRTTGSGASPGPFTDLFGFTFDDSEADSCSVTACSESQVGSLCDFSTNFCNTYNIFCNSADGCTTAKHDLTYTYTTDSTCDHTLVCGGVEADPSKCTR